MNRRSADSAQPSMMATRERLCRTRRPSNRVPPGLPRRRIALLAQRRRKRHRFAGQLGFAENAEPRLRTSTGWPSRDNSTTTTSSPPPVCRESRPLPAIGGTIAGGQCRRALAVAHNRKWPSVCSRSPWTSSTVNYRVTCQIWHRRRVEDRDMRPAFGRIDGPGGGRIAVERRCDRPAAVGCLRVVGRRLLQGHGRRGTIRRPARHARGSR